MLAIMRYPEGHKQVVHERIVHAAARALRRSGISGVGIPALMKDAGLTHGGFYAHFRDRDALVAEAIRSAASETSEGVLGDEHSLRDALCRYLSLGHAENPEKGCVIAALAAESPRQAKPVRRAFADAVRSFLRSIDAKLRPTAPGGAEASDDALRLASTMVGAIVLARAVDDRALAEQILEAARQAVR
jgi:AcrR family transcriptional regulator